MFIIQVPFINFDKIYESGQCLRWFKVSEGKYVVMHGDRAILIAQNKDRLIFHDTEENFFNIWYKYFALDEPYDEYLMKFKHEGKVLKKASVRGNGIRIIRQDMWESIIASAIAFPNPNDTLNAMENIASVFDVHHKNSFRDCGQKTWLEFPRPEVIVKKSQKLNESYLSEKRCGVILELANAVVDGWIDLEELRNYSYEEVHDILDEYMSQVSVDKVCLYSRGMLNVFPDTKSMKRILNSKKEGLDKDKLFERHKGIIPVSGLAYQLLLNNELNPPKEYTGGILNGFGRLN